MGECGAHCLGRALLRVPALGSLCRPRRERCRTERRRQQLHGLVEECPRLFLGDRRQAREMYPFGEYRGQSSLRSECVVNGVCFAPVPRQ